VHKIFSTVEQACLVISIKNQKKLSLFITMKIVPKLTSWSKTPLWTWI